MMIKLGEELTRINEECHANHIYIYIKDKGPSSPPPMEDERVLDGQRWTEQTSGALLPSYL